MVAKILTLQVVHSFNKFAYHTLCVCLCSLTLAPSLAVLKCTQGLFEPGMVRHANVEMTVLKEEVAAHRL